jgi:hypothetical protein
MQTHHAINNQQRPVPPFLIPFLLRRGFCFLRAREYGKISAEMGNGGYEDEIYVPGGRDLVEGGYEERMSFGLRIGDRVRGNVGLEAWRR